MTQRRYDSMTFLYIVLFLGSFAFYLKTMAPTVLWSDTAKLAIFVKESYLSFDPTLYAHPLHTVFGKPFSLLPLGNFAYRQNLMSAVFASLTILVLFLIIKRITKSGVAASLAALAFAVSQMFWLLAIMNESYTLVTFFIALQILFLLIWTDSKRPEFLWLWAFVFGFSFANNWLPLFCFPGYFYYILSNRKSWAPGFKSMFMTGMCFILGCGFLIWLFLEKGPGLPGIMPGSFLNISRKLALEVKVGSQNLSSLPMLKQFPVYLMYQFPIFGFLAGVYGTWRSILVKKRIFIFILLLLLSNLIICSIIAMPQRRFHYILPTYLFFTIWIGIGIEQLLRIKLLSKLKKISVFSLGLVLLVVFPVMGYYVAPSLARRFGLVDKVVGNVRRLHYRDNTRFYLWPSKNNEFGPYQYAILALKTFKPNTVVLADFNPGKVIEYFQEIDRRRPDVKLMINIDTYYYWGNPKRDIIDFIDKWIETNPVYIADDYEPYYFCRQIKKKYDIIKAGSVFEIQRRNH